MRNTNEKSIYSSLRDNPKLQRGNIICIWIWCSPRTSEDIAELSALDTGEVDNVSGGEADDGTKAIAVVIALVAMAAGFAAAQ